MGAIHGSRGTWTWATSHGVALIPSGQALAALVVHYDFDSAGATDISGNGNDGTIVGSPTYSSTGGYDGNGAYDFNFSGPNQYITGNASAIDNSAGGYNTVAFWMNWDGSNAEMVFRWGSAYDLFLFNGSFGYNTFQSANIYGIDSVGLAGDWVHVAAVFFNGNDALGSKLYIGGVEQTLTARNAGAGTQSATDQFYLAAHSGYGFNGMLDDFRIYNEELSANDIALLASGTGGAAVPTPGLVPLLMIGLLGLLPAARRSGRSVRI